MSTPIPTQPCPKCGHKLDASTYTRGARRPEPGNTSICVECGDIRIFDDSMRLRAPSKLELAEISNRPEIIQLQIYIASESKKK